MKYIKNDWAAYKSWLIQPFSACLLFGAAHSLVLCRQGPQHSQKWLLRLVWGQRGGDTDGIWARVNLEVREGPQAQRALYLLKQSHGWQRRAFLFSFFSCCYWILHNSVLNSLPLAFTLSDSFASKRKASSFLRCSAWPAHAACSVPYHISLRVRHWGRDRQPRPRFILL